MGFDASLWGTEYAHSASEILIFTVLHHVHGSAVCYTFCSARLQESYLLFVALYFALLLGARWLLLLYLLVLFASNFI